MGRLEGKVALVTGAARGQGRGYAVRMAAEGADILAVDLCADVDSVPYPLAGTAELARTTDLVEDQGRGALAVQADVRDFDALERAVAAGIDRFGHLDVVVANAGVLSFGSLMEMEERTFRDVLDTNLVGVWNTCRAAGPPMIDARQGGSIIIIGSAGATKGMANVGHYIASKHGVLGLMKSLAIELGEHSIRVNAIHPGTVLSGMTDNEATVRLFLPDKEAATVEDLAEVAQTLNLLPAPWALPDDLAGAVIFLASEEAKAITGASLSVDLGMTLK